MHLSVLVLLAATHQYEAVARQNLVNTLVRHNEVHNYNVQMQVRQLEQEAYARFPQRQRELLSRQLEQEAHARFPQRQRELSSRFSQEANQALEDQREIYVTKGTSEKYGEYDLRSKLSPQALHSKDVSQPQSQEYAELISS